MKLSEYIKLLQDFSKTCEDLEVTMTESGYYSQGDECLYELPEIKKVAGETMIVLGHSQQNG